MSRKKPPEERIASIAPFGLRMPAELRAMVEQAAADNDRSMNSEIIDRLYGSFDGPRLTDQLVLNKEQAGRLAEGLKAIADSAIPLGGGATLYFTVNDAEARAERVAENRGEREMLPTARERTKPKPD